MYTQTKIRIKIKTMRGFILHIIVVDTVKEPIFFTKISCEKIPQSSSKKSKKWIWKFHVKNEEII